MEGICYNKGGGDDMSIVSINDIVTIIEIVLWSRCIIMIGEKIIDYFYN